MASQIGDNITTDIQGDTLTLTIDLAKPGTVSRSGKSSVIASTRGNLTITDGNGEDVKIGLNIYRSIR